LSRLGATIDPVGEPIAEDQGPITTTRSFLDALHATIDPIPEPIAPDRGTIAAITSLLDPW